MPTFNFIMDVSSLEGIEDMLSEMQPQINAILAPTVNLHGQAMRRNTIDAVTSYYGGAIPRGAITQAISERPAVGGGPVASYSMVSSEQRFPYVRWITMRDERVCPICGPRHGVIYRAQDAAQIHPAHPNCRCRLMSPDLTAQVMIRAPEHLAVAVSDTWNDLSAQIIAIWNSAR